MDQQIHAWNSEPSRIQTDQRYILAIAISITHQIIVTSNSWNTLKVYNLKGNLMKTFQIRETCWNLQFCLNDNYLVAECYNLLIVLRVQQWQCQVIYYSGNNRGLSKLHNRLPYNFRCKLNYVIQDQLFPKIKIVRKIKCTQDLQYQNRLSIYEKDLLIGGAQLSLIQLDSLKTLWYYDYRELDQYATQLYINYWTDEIIYLYHDQFNNKHKVEIRALYDGKVKKEILSDLTSIIDGEVLQIHVIGEYILTATMDGDIDIWQNDVKIKQLKYETDNWIASERIVFSTDKQVLLVNFMESFEIYKV